MAKARARDFSLATSRTSAWPSSCARCAVPSSHCSPSFSSPLPAHASAPQRHVQRRRRRGCLPQRQRSSKFDEAVPRVLRRLSSASYPFRTNCPQCRCTRLEFFLLFSRSLWPPQPQSEAATASLGTCINENLPLLPAPSRRRRELPRPLWLQTEPRVSHRRFGAACRARPSGAPRRRRRASARGGSRRRVRGLPPACLWHRRRLRRPAAEGGRPDRRTCAARCRCWPLPRGRCRHGRWRATKPLPRARRRCRALPCAPRPPSPLPATAGAGVCCKPCVAKALRGERSTIGKEASLSL